MTKTNTIKLVSRKDAREELKRKGFNVSKWADEVMDKIEFTEGVEYEIAVLKTSDIGTEYPTTAEIRKKAKELGYSAPHPEVGVLLRLALTDKEIEDMGLWYVVAMHEPIKDSVGGPRLLYADRDAGGRWLHAYYDYPDFGWHREGGFAFLVSNPITNLDERIEKDLNDCWNWKGAKRKGYGMVKIKQIQKSAHRVVFETLVAKIPNGMVLDHICNNRSCVNPEHLKVCYQRENILRTNAPTAINARKTHCKRGHELSSDNLIKSNDGKRYCKKCKVIRNHEK